MKFLGVWQSPQSDDVIDEIAPAFDAAFGRLWRRGDEIAKDFEITRCSQTAREGRPGLQTPAWLFSPASTCACKRSSLSNLPAPCRNIFHTA